MISNRMVGRLSAGITGKKLWEISPKVVKGSIEKNKKNILVGILLYKLYSLGYISLLSTLRKYLLFFSRGCVSAVLISRKYSIKTMI